MVGIWYRVKMVCRVQECLLIELFPRMNLVGSFWDILLILSWIINPVKKGTGMFCARMVALPFFLSYLPQSLKTNVPCILSNFNLAWNISIMFGRSVFQLKIVWIVQELLLFLASCMNYLPWMYLEGLKPSTLNIFYFFSDIVILSDIVIIFSSQCSKDCCPLLTIWVISHVMEADWSRFSLLASMITVV